MLTCEKLWTATCSAITVVSLADRIRVGRKIVGLSVVVVVSLTLHNRVGRKVETLSVIVLVSETETLTPADV